MKNIHCVCVKTFSKTQCSFLHLKDVIEKISNEKLHLCEQGLSFIWKSKIFLKKSMSFS